MRLTMTIRGILLGIFIISTTAVAARAACDPSKILRQNVEQYNENILVFLSYIRNLKNSINQGSDAAVGISYDGIGLSLADANSLADNILQNKNYQIDDGQSEAVLRATLSTDDVKAFIACGNSKDPLHVILPDAALTDQVFHFKVIWDPDFPAKPSAVSVHVANGTIDGGTTKSLTMQPADTLDLEVKRDGDGSKTLLISTFIYGRVSDPVSVPGIPPFTLTLKPKSRIYDELKRDGRDGAAYEKHDLCIYPDGDAILLPATMKFIGTPLVGDPNKAKAGIYSKENTGFQSCGYIENSASSDEDFNEIGGQFIVFETQLVPTSPGKPGAKADMTKRLNRYEDINAILREAAGTE